MSATSPILLETSLPLPLAQRGKVRDVYDLKDRLLLVSTDRISAFDWVLPSGIPDKGKVLTQISRFWFDFLGVRHHMLSANAHDFGLSDPVDIEPLVGRSMLVLKADVVPVECVVRGYLSGSGWREYQQSGSVCGVELPVGLVESARLPRPIFTPATKAREGHDENISLTRMAEMVGADLAAELQRRSLEVYERGAAWAASRGIIIADTKLEWGERDGELLLVDEVLTPDSSRFWPADSYAPGGPQPSFDKQYVRDWLSTSGWDRESPPPALPAAIVTGTRDRYIEAYTRLTGQPWDADT